ncbi:hypothetical protein NC651_017098 [Populus alba x Populus x berolinensis]|nr:hypothetical protein NC651_017098 [Populus alba x Populus x berolinensis]
MNWGMLWGLLIPQLRALSCGHILAWVLQDDDVHGVEALYGVK